MKIIYRMLLADNHRLGDHCFAVVDVSYTHLLVVCVCVSVCLFVC